jgi:hypothetical protein
MATYAYVAMLFTIIVFHTGDVVDGLVPDAATRWEKRTRAFGLHPNLEGYLFGGGALLLLRHSFQVSLGWKVFYWCTVVVCVLIILAASVRASLLAMLTAGLLTLAFAYPKLDKRIRSGIGAVAGLITIVVALNYQSIVDYLWIILELGSDTRGFGTGGTGRVELWERGVAYISDSSSQILLGSGIRSSSAEYIGFSTESSYISILIDSGLIMGSILILTIVSSAIRSFWWVRGRQRAQLSDVLISALIVFCLVQAIFNRYLFAIGNPLSLLTIFVFMYAASGKRSDPHRRNIRRMIVRSRASGQTAPDSPSSGSTGAA